ncbi:hypothetical protein [Azotobacter salinestris]|uniref:hypothetical protein n=1 Tax=Azotobacter salinestris TaxID=69964 RepID=UPI0032DEC44A
MQKVIVGLLAGTVLLSGCARHSETPIATNFEYQKQLKMQAASHWQLIAQDTAKKLMAQVPERRPLHVLQTSRQSPFEQAFNQQLIASLLAAGYPLMKKGASHNGALVVEVSAVPIPFSPNRKQYKTTGGLTMLASGLWVLESIYDDVSPGAAAVAAAAAVDASSWLRSEFASGPTPRTELVVTTNISSDERYYAQTTNAYYTSDGDWHLYAQQPAQLPAVILPVKGSN